jgi:hypothetical protein
MYAIKILKIQLMSHHGNWLLILQWTLQYWFCIIVNLDNFFVLVVKQCILLWIHIYLVKKDFILLLPLYILERIIHIPLFKPTLLWFGTNKVIIFYLTVIRIIHISNKVGFKSKRNKRAIIGWVYVQQLNIFKFKLQRKLCFQLNYFLK